MCPPVGSVIHQPSPPSAESSRSLNQVSRVGLLVNCILACSPELCPACVFHYRGSQVALDTAQEGKIRDQAHSAHSQERVVGTTVRHPDTAAEGGCCQSINGPQSLLVKVDGITSCRAHQGLPWGLSGKESVCQCRRRGFNPWVGKIPWRRKWQPTPVSLPGKSHGQRGAWRARVHGVTNESDST